MTPKKKMEHQNVSGVRCLKEKRWHQHVSQLEKKKDKASTMPWLKILSRILSHGEECRREAAAA